MLQVAVHYQAAGAMGGFKPGKDGGFLSEISGKGDAFGLRVLGRKGLNTGIGGIRGTIVYKNDFKRDSVFCHNPADGKECVIYIVLLVAGRKDDGKKLILRHD